MNSADDIVSAVLAAAPRLGQVRLVALDGPSGSGKSTIAAKLREHFAALVSVELVPTDHFATWDDPFDWWPRLEVGVLQPLSIGGAARYLANDWSSGAPVPSVAVAFAPPEVLILEGVSATRRALDGRAQLTCWIEVRGAAQRLERAVNRDGEASREHLQRWQVAEQTWFAREETKSRADLCIYPT